MISMMNRMSIKALMVASLGLMTPALAQAKLPGDGIKVVPVQSSIQEESFQTEIIVEGLKQLGYDVAPIQQTSYNVAYKAVAQGDATFLADNWVPLSAQKYQAAGGDKVFYREGTYIENAAQGYLIDKKTADKYHITNIAQLKDPKLARLFDADGDGKADLTSCAPGWSCEDVIAYHLHQYGLSDTVKANGGNYAAMLSDTIARYREGKPVLYYTWTPYWVSGVLIPGKDVVWLQVPFSAIPGKPNIDTRLANGKNYGFRMGAQRIVANRQWAENNPAAAKLFALAKLDTRDISAENLMMRRGQSSEADIQRHAKHWIKAHQKIFNQWIAAAKKAVQ